MNFFYDCNISSKGREYKMDTVDNNSNFNDIVKKQSESISKPSKLIIRGDENHKQIVFSYDAGFNDNETSQILYILKKYNVKATFFLTGLWVEKFPQLARLIAYEGHEIGNHSYDHPDMVTLSHDEIVKNILKGGEVIKRITGVDPCPLFREPFGSWNKKVFKAVGAAGYKYSIYWSIDTIDWQHPSTRVMVNRILRKAKGGEIVLMHIDGNHTAEVSDIAIRNLKAAGFKFLTVGELLEQ
jgi:peptidoglycan/xylan/chitin deacetylase (PgdA/CDA1 family)